MEKKEFDLQKTQRPSTYRLKSQRTERTHEISSKKNLNLIDLASGADSLETKSKAEICKLKAFKTALKSGRQDKTKNIFETITIPTRYLNSEYRSSLAKISARSNTNQGKMKLQLTDSRSVGPYRPDGPITPDPKHMSMALKIGNYKKMN